MQKKIISALNHEESKKDRKEYQKIKLLLANITVKE